VIPAIDNSPDRTIDVFFYGLYMDPEMLRSMNVKPRRRRPAVAEGYSLRIGQQATLVRDTGAATWGIVYAITHSEMDYLYGASSMSQYRPEPLLVRTIDEEFVPALCCNLLHAPTEGAIDSSYAEVLREAMARANLPGPYLE
jgi:hypothetical protein